MTAEFEETTLNLPWDVIDAGTGFGIDIGKSIASEYIVTVYTYMYEIKLNIVNLFFNFFAKVNRHGRHNLLARRICEIFAHAYSHVNTSSGPRK